MIVTKFLRSNHFAHILIKQIIIQNILYGFLNEASWRDKFSGTHEKFEDQYGPKMGLFTKI